MSDGRLEPDQSLVWRWTRAQARPTEPYLRALAVILGATVEVLRAEAESDFRRLRRTRGEAQPGQVAPGAAGAGPAKPAGAEPAGSGPAAPAGSAEPAEPAGPVPAEPGEPEATRSLREAYDVVDRRSVLQAMLATAGAGPIVDLTQALEESRLTTAAIEGLAVSTHHFGHTFDRYDLGELGHQLGFHLSAVARHLRQPITVGQRSELCFNGARLAGLAGSVAFLTGKVAHATMYDDLAFRLAEEIADEAMMAWLICEQASVECYAGSLVRAEQMMHVATSVHDVAQRANALSNAARAHARRQERAAAMRAIRRTEEAAMAIGPALDSAVRGPMWSFSQISAFTRIAESWLLLGEGRQAIEAIGRVLAVGQHVNGRFNAHAGLMLATAHAGLGDVDQACAIASEVFAARPQDSHSISQRAAVLFRKLKEKSAVTEIERLNEEFRHYLATFHPGSG